ncbi:hypothetical protein GGD56_000848 [Rhizobium mongolense]|uniref:Uncharacterized protein n=1 Tax=Rhizobium mongolense TaxID=57676 RepID=A0ABR6IH84_9HYPH|nr:hypothetical protein [Rhizobium mongolense]
MNEVNSKLAQRPSVKQALIAVLSVICGEFLKLLDPRGRPQELETRMKPPPQAMRS